MKILATVAVSLSIGLFACGKGGEGSAATPESICAHVKTIAESEGGEALETYKKRLAGDCIKELGEAKAEIGEGFPKFAACVMGKKKFSEVMEGCNPRDFKEKKKDEPKKDEAKKPDGK